MHSRLPLAAFVGLLCITTALADETNPVIPLWPNGAPGFESRKNEKEVRHYRKSGEYSVTNVQNPSLTVFLPAKDTASGAAVVLVPGGGHRELWPIHEGFNEAKWLSQHGVAAFVLKYRLAREKGSPYKIEVHALQDGQRAIRLVRSRAADWGIDPHRVGMMGFSAGGEVTAMVSSRPGQGNPDSSDPVDRQSAHPDFQALIYSGPLGIIRTKATKDIPPTFIVVGDQDHAGSWLTRYYQELKKAGVSAELHVYAKMGHGFGFRSINRHHPSSTWIERFIEWLGVEGMLHKS